MSDFNKIWGYIYTDADGNPSSAEVSVLDPQTNPDVNKPYRLIYIGDDNQACLDAINASFVVVDGKAVWSSHEETTKDGSNGTE